LRPSVFLCTLRLLWIDVDWHPVRRLALGRNQTSLVDELHRFRIDVIRPVPANPFTLLSLAALLDPDKKFRVK
jgi:hypothetical protein